MHTFTLGIRNHLRQHRDPGNAAAMKKYMRDQFEFFGIKMELRRRLFREFTDKHPEPEGKELHTVVGELWEQPERELQYVAIELLIRNRKSWKRGDISFFEQLVVRKSWWDTVDYLSGSVIGPWFQKYPDTVTAITGRWNASSNLWLQRVSLLFQLKYKEQTNLPLLISYIENLRQSPEFFIQKAIGWVLREYSKTDPGFVRKFVKEHELKPLSRREALKVLSKK